MGPAGAGCSEQGGQEVWERVPPAPAPRLSQDAAPKAFQGSAPLGRTCEPLIRAAGLGKLSPCGASGDEGAFLFSVQQAVLDLILTAPISIDIPKSQGIKRGEIKTMLPR